MRCWKQAKSMHILIKNSTGKIPNIQGDADLTLKAILTSENYIFPVKIVFGFFANCSCFNLHQTWWIDVCM